jgi:hypothetical protein
MKWRVAGRSLTDPKVAAALHHIALRIRRLGAPDQPTWESRRVGCAFVRFLVWQLIELFLVSVDSALNAISHSSHHYRPPATSSQFESRRASNSRLE